MRPVQILAASLLIVSASFVGLDIPGLYTQPASAATNDGALARAIAGPWRTASLVARDGVRHPQAELDFFGIQPSMTVIEIWPGGGYWTEILAPYLHDNGTLYAARFPVAKSGEFAEGNDAFQRKLNSNKAVYGNVRVTAFGKGADEIAPVGSADMVLTFRNIHNWMEGGFADEAFAAFYKALKPGGILGVEEHRAAADKPQDPAARSGYVRQDFTIELAKKAGFELVGSSEINANPKDTKDYPEGVWTLPPTFALGDKDRAKYAAIGEADNFVLKFRKPTK